MTHFGEHQAGVCLGGEYTLERFLNTAEDAGGEGAYFEARTSAGETVLLKLAAAENPEERLFLWRRTAHLQHPNLLRLLDSGTHENQVYAVFEPPDDVLANALEQGPLEENDARDFLAAALDALRYLHAQGLVHGSLDAAHVVAVGNTVKLSTDNLREPEGDFTYAGDIGALGALLYHVLTGRKFEGRADGIGEPFATIVRNTAGVPAEDRWRIPEIAAAMGPAPQPEPQPQAPPEPVTAPEVAAVEERSPAALPPPAVRPTAIDLEEEAPPPQTAGPHIPRWAWPASIAVIVGCFAWVFHSPSHKDALPPAVAAPATAPAAVPAPAPTARPAPSVVPERRADPPSAERAAEPPRERAVWRVIAYTYHAMRDAETRAVAINRKWPGMHAEVFAPKGRNNPPYLVALGGRMDRMAAARVLQRARSRGLPRDTFMLNFEE